MTVDFAFVCDYAEVGGKINAMGIGFDTIFAGSIPCKHPSFFLVIQLRTNVVEAGEKNMEVHLIDDDGKDIIPVARAKFNTPKPAISTESVGKIAMQFHNVEFPRYGSYSLHAVIEGLELVRIPIRISPIPKPQ